MTYELVNRLYLRPDENRARSSDVLLFDTDDRGGWFIYFSEHRDHVARVKRTQFCESVLLRQIAGVAEGGAL